jgi:hypothetical protein
MGTPNQIERRRTLADRRNPPRPIRCMNCGVLLTYERRGSIVRLYRSATAMPLRVAGPDERNTPVGPPRCVVCNELLVPGTGEPPATDGQQHA